MVFVNFWRFTVEDRTDRSGKPQEYEIEAPLLGRALEKLRQKVDPGALQIFKTGRALWETDRFIIRLVTDDDHLIIDDESKVLRIRHDVLRKFCNRFKDGICEAGDPCNSDNCLIIKHQFELYDKPMFERGYGY